MHIGSQSAWEICIAWALPVSPTWMGQEFIKASYFCLISHISLLNSWLVCWSVLALNENCNLRLASWTVHLPCAPVMEIAVTDNATRGWVFQCSTPNQLILLSSKLPVFMVWSTWGEGIGVEDSSNLRQECYVLSLFFFEVQQFFMNNHFSIWCVAFVDLQISEMVVLTILSILSSLLALLYQNVLPALTCDVSKVEL